jgi:hypothetical protein
MLYNLRSNIAKISSSSKPIKAKQNSRNVKKLNKIDNVINKAAAQLEKAEQVQLEKAEQVQINENSSNDLSEYSKKGKILWKQIMDEEESDVESFILNCKTLKGEDFNKYCLKIEEKQAISDKNHKEWNEHFQKGNAGRMMQEKFINNI